ncbi:hypothetical protein J0J70_00095 [Turicibacter bilis]|uniref:Uncharacterized protein n=1 Tax=Turicibacter bilis TaxID=2735723 RepID=A0A9Q9CPV1_9FIRM|nr:hypothetical protein [Turicibacter bilis]MBS3198949.1 hypothetical protein [Turicibacter bilis]UUF08492.1 hypothetical protein J0J70_00095 [Turicibacter bilis]
MKDVKLGRKPKYTNEFLINTLNAYFKKNPFEKIKLSKLERETGIPRHIWRDNEVIQELIHSLNNTSCIPARSERKFELPSADEIVSKHYGNKARLIENVQGLLDLVSDMYSDALKGSEFKELEKNYQRQIAELNETIAQKNRLIDNLNKEIDSLYLDSENPIKRKEKGLKTNLIEINAENIKKLSKDISEIEAEFEGLFD